VEIRDARIDAGNAFDFGRTASDYAKYRDIYPEEFYQRIVRRGLCCKGQRVLDVGTGTGVLPRNMYRFGADWTGTDISPEQIAQAKQLAADGNMPIGFVTSAAENLPYDDGSFDVITACQCFWYFDHETVLPRFAELLKDDGCLLILYMAWLPYEDAVAGESEKLVLRYSPAWTGAGETRHPIAIPDAAYRCFDLESHEEYDLHVPFTRESWHGRMRACRGVGASLSDEALSAWDAEHRALLEQIAPEQFTVLHYAAMAVLRKKGTA